MAPAAGGVRIEQRPDDGGKVHRDAIEVGGQPAITVEADDEMTRVGQHLTELLIPRDGLRAQAHDQEQGRVDALPKVSYSMAIPLVEAVGIASVSPSVVGWSTSGGTTFGLTSRA